MVGTGLAENISISIDVRVAAHLTDLESLAATPGFAGPIVMLIVEVTAHVAPSFHARAGGHFCKLGGQERPRF